MRIKKIYISGDHAGFKLKKSLKEFFDNLKIPYEDFGPHKYNSKDDYPDFVIPMAKKVAREKNSIGIIIGGSGQGEAMAVNKIKKIRAALYYGGSIRFLKYSREHNDSNILCLGGRFLNKKQTEQAIRIWIKTPFEGGRHKRRLEKVRRKIK